MLAREAELHSLRTQLDPHFLFNSLSSVSALVTSDPKQARQMCGRLASFFRRTLDLGAKSLVSLADEIELVQDYLAIEKVRFGDRLGCEIRVEDKAEDHQLPPLILQPLVENAVRHGIGHVLEGGTVTVRATLEQGGLRIDIGNPCDAERPASRGAGVGLQNVRRRLQAVFGSESRVLAQDHGDRFEVTLRLPAQPKGARERSVNGETHVGGSDV